MQVPVYQLKLDKETGVQYLYECEVVEIGNRKKIDGSKIVVDIMKENFRIHEEAEEYFYVLFLSMGLSLIGIAELSHGTSDATLVSSRGVFLRALLMGACGVILVHNHPSGNTVPSNHDLAITKKLEEAGNLLDVKVLDHIIIGDTSLSFKDSNLLINK